jgi:hypothetical protein
MAAEAVSMAAAVSFVKRVRAKGARGREREDLMLTRRVALLSALFSLLLAVVPGTASSQANDLNIAHAEIVTSLGINDVITVGGQGVCASAGLVSITVQLQDLVTGATGISNALNQCVAAGEHIYWQVSCQCVGVQAQFRVGDRVRVTAFATGQISATDTRELTLKKQS